MCLQILPEKQIVNINIRVGFEPTTPVIERQKKTVYVLDCVAKVMGLSDAWRADPLWIGYSCFSLCCVNGGRI
jgi:hypothetical protein